MAEDEKNSAEKQNSRSGSLKSELSVAFNTHYAQVLWEGRQPDTTGENGKPKYAILSMPQVISRAGQAYRDAEADNPYADMALIKQEEAIEKSSAKIQKYMSSLDKTLSMMPKGVVFTEVESSKPFTVNVFSYSPLGYRCVWLLVGFDQLAMKAFQAFHYGLISRNQRDQFLSDGAYAVRQVYAVIQPYRRRGVTRADIVNLTEPAKRAIKRFGEVDPDVFSGKKRSSIAPPLRSTVKFNKDGSK